MLVETKLSDELKRLRADNVPCLSSRSIFRIQERIASRLFQDLPSAHQAQWLGRAQTLDRYVAVFGLRMTGC